MNRLWRVVETRCDRSGQPERVIPHTRIGSTPMSEVDARGYAAQETARYANADARRSFHAEPVPVTDERR